ncbi:NAD-glutamate dehydrogenase domain-containing protein [Pseudomonas glycinae]|uniref:NAD-glutamate dehydrogenase catalytic domain-containing protein n=1 Tax=Pseudomonas glycinae TaxID=1785145 RepID=A0ABM6QHN2_9PSED|nr:NAD-glutamate dehydrogenase domain-containing protein [Pseudomonas glycinae]AUG97409.1 hypothetical protein AWU82_28410 [Pseudomonas glycinae]
MSGDLFGNDQKKMDITATGCVRSTYMHHFLDRGIHIQAASITERQRMFDLARSTWFEYDDQHDVRRQLQLVA